MSEAKLWVQEAHRAPSRIKSMLPRQIILKLQKMKDKKKKIQKGPRLKKKKKPL